MSTTHVIQGVAAFVFGIFAVAFFTTWAFDPPLSTAMSTLLGMPIGFASVFIAMR